jgi:hypothetical protein
VASEDGRRRGDARVVPAANACIAIQSAQQLLQTAPRPIVTRLPVEPLEKLTSGALDEEVRRRQGDLSPYLMSSSDFDITFLTPIHVHAGRRKLLQPDTRAGRGNTRGSTALSGLSLSPTDFGAWTDYFAGAPPVLAVRVTPKLAENFWTTLGRAAAYTQGVALPAFKHFKSGFSQLRAFCGEVEVFPIQPFTVDRRVSDTDSIREGLYVFNPGSFGPHCKPVRLVLSAEQDPAKPDSRTVDSETIDRVWQDFAVYRALAPR